MLKPGVGALRCPLSKCPPGPQPALAAKHAWGLTRVCVGQDSIQLPQEGHGSVVSPKWPIVIPDTDPLCSEGLGYDLALLAGLLVYAVLHPLYHVLIRALALFT